MNAINNSNKWLIFIWERFPPFTHFPFMLLYFIAHYVFFLNDSRGNAPTIKLLILFLGTIIFFFKLRLYDEIKDYENDKNVHPDRPLVRGLLTHKNIHAGIYACILLELITFSAFGLKGLLAVSVPLIYSFLMFKEFFVKNWIRPHLTLYAVTHTLISALFSLALIAAIKSSFIWNLNSNSYLFALLSWCLFNIFEFGRKTFISDEEQHGVESYSKIYGRFGATLLVISMAACSIFILNKINLYNPIPITPFIKILLLLLSLIALLYIGINKQPLGNIYRASSFAFIGLVYLIFITIYLRIRF